MDDCTGNCRAVVEPFVETFVETIVRLPNILVLRVRRALELRIRLRAELQGGDPLGRALVELCRTVPWRSRAPRTPRSAVTLPRHHASTEWRAATCCCIVRTEAQQRATKQPTLRHLDR